jgi:integrase/recombinase XerD
MKNNRFGQAKILTQSEIESLFSQGLTTARDRALFGICLWTTARVNEACTLRARDVFSDSGVLLPELTIRWYNTKGKLDTRQIPITENLADLLLEYGDQRTEYLFPGRHGRGHINPQSASHILRDACKRVGLVGVSTHSFRRSTITAMHRNGVGLKTIQSISGHSSLRNLERYIAVDDRAKRDAISALSF